MPEKLYDRRGEIDLLGRALAANGPLTRDKVLQLVGDKIPPERAFAMCRMKDKESLPHDVVIASGRRSIVRAGLNNWLLPDGLLVERDGLLYATARFRRDYPELFIEEMRAKPDLYQLALRLVGNFGPERQAGGVTINSGLRLALREMLRLCDRDVSEGVPFHRSAATTKATGHHDNGKAEAGSAQAAGSEADEG